MSENIDISFCLPVYNVSGWIEACVNSIVDQNLTGINYEIVCVDDCSTDDSLAVLKKLSMQNPRVVVVASPENKGVSATRNTAIRSARGTFIWFVDPDDLLYPGAVERMYKAISESSQDVIIGNYMKVNEDAKWSDFEKSDCECTTVLVSSKDNIGAKDAQRTNNGYGMCSSCCGIFRRSFLVENNLYFRENIHFQEDTVFYYEFTRRTEQVLSSNCLCYLYRQRRSSAIHARNDERTKKYYNSLLNMLGVYLEYEKKSTEKDPELSKKIHQSKEKVAQVLAMVSDTGYVKKELKSLRQKGFYSYRLRWDVLRSEASLAMRLVLFLLPIPMFFWLTHYAFKAKSSK